MKRNKIIAGLAVGACMLVVQMLIGILFQALFPSLKEEYTNSGIFRPWSDPVMSLMFLQPFIVGIILAYIWNYTKSIIIKETDVKRGIYFGFIYFIISLPGMLMSYASFPLSLLMIFNWTAGIFVQSICAGIVLSKMVK
jgi:hypothetical protein